VTKIVAFACGTMHTTKKDVRGLAPAYQHALILTMRDILENQPGQSSEQAKTIQCFAQDPVYTEADDAVFGNAGITVPRDPRAFLEVDDQSLVISFAPNVPVRQIIADIAQPAVIIWDRVMSEAETVAFWSAIIDDDDDDIGFHPGRM
jgi:hypothetical protein